MRDRKLAVQIEESLHRLDLGEDLIDILADYPDQQVRIKPFLLIAMASRSFPLPSPGHTAQRLGKNQMLEEMESLRAQGLFRKKHEVRQQHEYSALYRKYSNPGNTRE